MSFQVPTSWLLLLGMQVAALREKLTDQRAERGQVEHFRQV